MSTQLVEARAAAVPTEKQRMLALLAGVLVAATPALLMLWLR